MIQWCHFRLYEQKWCHHPAKCHSSTSVSFSHLTRGSHGQEFPHSYLGSGVPRAESKVLWLSGYSTCLVLLAQGVKNGRGGGEPSRSKYEESRYSLFFEKRKKCFLSSHVELLQGLKWRSFLFSTWILQDWASQDLLYSKQMLYLSATAPVHNPPLIFFCI